MKVCKLWIMIFLITPVLYGHGVTSQKFIGLNERIKKNPKDVEALMMRSHYYVTNKLYQEAINDMEQIFHVYSSLETAPHPRLYFDIAELYFKVKNFDKALYNYDKLLSSKLFNGAQKSSVYWNALWNKSLICYNTGRRQEAWQGAQKVLKAVGDSLTVIGKSAEMAEAVGEYQEAANLYMKAMEKYPHIASEKWLNRTLYFLIKVNNLEEAKKFLERLEKKLGEEPMVYFYRGVMAKHYLKDSELFNASMEQAQQKSKQFLEEGDELVGNFWIARILLETEKNNKALEAVNKAISAEEGHVVLYKLRKNIYNSLGQKKQVEQDQQKIKEMNEDDWLEYYIFPVIEQSSEKKE